MKAMMKKWTRALAGTRHSIQIRAFLLNSALATVIVVTLAMLIFGWFQRRSLEDINAMTKVLLGNMDYKATDLMSGTGGLAYQLYLNNNVTELILSEDRNVTNEVRVSTAIENLMISNPYLQSVYVVGPDGVRMRKDRGSYYDAETDADILAFVKESRILTAIPRRIDVGRGATLNVFSIVYHDAAPNDELRNGAIVVNINADTWFRYVSSRISESLGRIFVIDAEGRVLSDQDRSLFLKNLADAPDIAQILARMREIDALGPTASGTDARNSGTLYAELDGERHAVSWVRSEDGSRISVARMPYRTMTESLRRARNFILVVCAAYLVLLAVFYFLLTRRLWRPVTQIADDIRAGTRRLGLEEDGRGGEARDEVAYISRSMSGVLDYIHVLDRREKDNIFIVRNGFIRELLEGDGPVPRPAELAKGLARARIAFDPSRPFLVAVLRLDEPVAQEAGEDGGRAKELLLFSIGNIACELLGEGFSGHAFESSGDHEILLVNADVGRLAAMAEAMDREALGADDGTGTEAGAADARIRVESASAAKNRATDFRAESDIPVLVRERLHEALDKTRQLLGVSFTAATSTLCAGIPSGAADRSASADGGIAGSSVSASGSASGSCSVGPIVGTSAGTASHPVSTLRDAYRAALAATDARLLQGEGRVYPPDALPMPGSASDPHAGDAEMARAIAAVREMNREAFDRALRELLEKAARMPHETAVLLLSRLHADMSGVLDALNAGSGAGDRSESDVIAAWHEIEAMTSPRQLSDWFGAAFERVRAQLATANRIAAKDLVDEAIRWIDQNYGDSQISGSSLARRLSISPQTFSKVFSERTGSAFPEYLNRVRLEKARALLLESDLSALEIGEKVGYANRSYFSTLFKKAYGVSPVKYRMMHAKA